MSEDHVLRILDVLHLHGVTATIDGGWGIDALLGEQTRPHNDLDLVIPLDRVNDILVALAPLGYALAEDQLPTRFVLREASGSQLDFHPVTFDREGGGTQALPGGESFRYPPESFSRGRIGGMEVPCISAQGQILAHLGYEPTEKDARDMLVLCRRFGLEIPQAYERFTGEPWG